MKESDFILISLPLTKTTSGLIGKDQIDLMKPTGILVNISRGAIIDEESLYNALTSKSILGASIDTWYVYPKDRNNPTNVFQNFPFHELDNVILSPHRAFKVRDREITHTEDIIEMRQLKNIDVALVCMNLPYTMTVEQAASAVLDFKPGMVIPYHYRGKNGFSDLQKFKKLVSGNRKIKVKLLNWY